MESKNFYVTTPIYYVNDLPHIGHVYTTVVADVVARYKKLMGYEVYFLTGTDEHGLKVEKAAKEKGLKPIELADSVVENYKKLWPKLYIKNSDFIRTTEERHIKGAIALFNKMKENGDIYLGKYKGKYCVSCEAVLTEFQAKNNKCPDCGKPVEDVEEESYFFKLSKYQKKLLEFYEQNPDFIQPENRRNEVISFVKSGLKDLSISRTSFKWGIPIPGDEKHVMYVWLDALSNYITALGYPDDTELFKKFWPADLHLVGKDILRFHAVYWPAFLMSANLPLPKTVYAHGWWLKDSGKMSKSVGNIVRPQYLLDQFGADALRYFLLREMVFGNDCNFSDEAFLNRLNSDLANDLGNLVSRTLSMIAKYKDGVIPEPDRESEEYREIESLAKTCGVNWESYFDTYQFHKALSEVWIFLNHLNRFIVKVEPWKLVKDSTLARKLDTVLYVLAESLRLVALYISPAMPEKSQEIWNRIGFNRDIETSPITFLKFGVLEGGIKINAVKEHLFPRIDIKEYFRDVEKNKGEVEKVEGKDFISIEDFAKVQLKIARVLEAEKIEKSNKLLKLQIDLGGETRQIVAGIARKYKPEDLVGRLIVVVANLKPAKLMGVQSNGMLLAASGDDGEPFILTPDSGAKEGFRVK